MWCCRGKAVCKMGKRSLRSHNGGRVRGKPAPLLLLFRLPIPELIAGGSSSLPVRRGGGKGFPPQTRPPNLDATPSTRPPRSLTRSPSIPTPPAAIPTTIQGLQGTSDVRGGLNSSKPGRSWGETWVGQHRRRNVDRPRYTSSVAVRSKASQPLSVLSYNQS